ncbi:MAG: CHAT domain-containing protein [Marmoricola sp.]
MPTFAGGTLRVTPPRSYDAQRARAQRGLPGEAAEAPSKDALVAALEESDLALVEKVDLTPRRTRDLGDEPVPNRPATVKVEVDVPAGEDAVVLLERDGVYSWHLPKNPAQRTRSLELGTRTALFDIDVQPRPTKRPPKPRRTPETRTRGLLGDLVQGAAQALVFRFAAPVLLEKAIEAMEAHVRPGLVHLTDADVSTWKRFETLDQLHLPTGRPVRILLFVHGTFSTTVSAFGALGVDENGKGFLRTAIAAYDAVIGFDHKTLSVDPRENARNLLKRLRRHRPQDQFVIDVITHSRGGLVTRAFAEEVLPAADWPGTVDIAVFVAATNAGTRLADPKRWNDLIDLYTNLASATATGLSVIPGAAPVAVVVGGVVKGIGAFVKYLVSYAAEGDDVPGLKAMVPGGSFIKELNQTQPGQPGPGTNWFVVSSNFHVRLFDDHHNPPEFPRELAVKLAEGFVDRIFESDNDLVVDTASMPAIDRAVGGFVRDSFDLGENDVVYHTNYFSQLSVIEAMAGWLPLGLGAGGGEETAAMAEPPAFPEPLPEASDAFPSAPSEAAMPEDDLHGGRDRVSHGSSDRQRSAPQVTTRGLPTIPRQRETEEQMAEAPPAATEPTRASLAAEMPLNVVEKVEFPVRVRLSRKTLQATSGTAHAESDVTVDALRPVSVQVIGKANAKVVGLDSDVFALPPGGGVSELEFRAQSLATGPVVVMVVVRQGSIPIANLRLQASAVSKDAAGTVSLGSSVTASAHPGIDAPELEGLPCIDIVERELPSGSVIYQYAVRLVPGESAVTFESRPIKDRVRRIGKILDDVADVWKDTGADPRERERKLQDIGAKMFDELFPEDMQAHLWKHRSKVKDLIIYADEPFVPWELVHLKPPTGPRPDKPRFLAQSGLVRWQLGSFPPREMRVRPGHARSLCPEYRDPRFALTEPVQERLFLEEQFGAKPVTATPAGVRALLRTGKFDLLHFSGHGAADPDDILDAKLLLQGRKRGGTVEAQYLGATTVSENATWTRKGQEGPLVVLNACQVGRAGELLSTVGGFAQAFLDAGASAFVSCLWSVQQEPSRRFVEKLYEELLDGTPMGLASARAREATRKAGDATWLSFVVYARPDAVLVRS